MMERYALAWYFCPHALFYILFFLWTWSFSMKFSIMASPRYYDATQFLTYPNENCTEYVKLEIKDILFLENFLIFGIFIEKITIYYEIHVYSAVTLHLPPPIPFGPPIRVGFVRDTSFTYLRILFQHKKKITKLVKTRVDPYHPLPFGLPIRGVLVLVVP